MAAPTIITGYRGGASGNATQRILNFDQKIITLHPPKTPLVVLTSRIKKRVTTNPKYEWFEDQLMPYWDAINLAAGYSAVATSLVVDNPEYFEIGSLVRVMRTGEVFRVSNMTTDTNPLTVVRGSGAAALVDNEPLMILSDSNEEGSSSRDAKIIQLTNDYNYTQIFRTSVAITDTEAQTSMYGGDEMARQRKKRGVEHLEKIERAFWFGERTYTVGTHPRRTTGGVFNYLSSNVTDVGGMLTEWSFEKICEDVFAYGSKIKWAFCGKRPISVINMWGKNKMDRIPKDKTYGLVVDKYISAHGELNFVEHPMFTGDVLANTMAILDLAEDNIEYRFMNNRNTKFKTNIQATDVDGEKDEYITEVGVQVKNADMHWIVSGVRA